MSWTSPILLFVGVSSVLSTMWLLNVRRLRDAHVDHHRLLTRQTALRVADFINTKISQVEIIRARMRGGRPDQEHWHRQMAYVFAHSRGFQALNFVDPSGRIAIIFPVAGNEAALGRNLTDHPVAGAALRTALADHAMHATAPLQLYQGGRGFTVYASIVSASGRVEGAVNAVFRMDQIAEATLSHVKPQDARVWIRDGDTYLWGTPPGETDVDQFEERIRIVDHTWTLVLSPDHQPTPVEAHIAAVFVILLGATLAAGMAVLRRRLYERNVRAGAEQARLKRRLQESERLEAVGQLAGGVAHDFNNLLTIITGSGELLLEDVADQPDLKVQVEALLDAAERGSLLTRQLLTFAKRDPIVETGHVDLVSHLIHLEPMLRHAAGRNVAFELQLPKGRAPVGVSAGSLDRIVLNLVRNAGEALNDAGAVEVVVAVDDGFAELCVRDDGPGMSAAVQDRVFEPFFTTREDGTGLGLATVYGLVQRAGGAVDVRSAPGEGAAFEVRLPLVDTPPTEDDRLVADGTLAVVVDDEALVRRIMRRALERRGFTVAEAPDGRQALEVVRLAPPALLVTDVRMPRMNGVDLARRVRREFAEVAIILVSGYTDATDDIESLLGPKVRFINKPFETNQLAGVACGLVTRNETSDSGPEARASLHD